MLKPNWTPATPDRPQDQWRMLDGSNRTLIAASCAYSLRLTQLESRLDDIVGRDLGLDAK